MLAKRSEAKARGDRHYFTGRPCPRGHLARRLTSIGQCVECGKENAQAWRDDHQQEVRKQDRARYAANPKKRSATVYAWRLAHPDYMPIYLKGWHEANPLKKREYTHRRRALKLAAEGSHADTDIERILKDQRGRCAHPWCRKKLGDDYHVDHIIALVNGGSNWPSNLQLLCEPCNQRKSTKCPIEHAQEHGMLL